MLLETSLDGIYSKTRKFYNLQVDSLPDHDKRDVPMFDKIKRCFDPVAADLRKAAGVQTNNDGQFGFIRKERRGGMGNPWLLAPHVDYMVNTLMSNAVSVIMENVHDEDIMLCSSILKKEAMYAGTRKDEENLQTSDVQKAAQRLKDKGVTCQDISLMSVALYIIDSFTSACISRQDKSNLLARNTFVVEDGHDRVIDILPSHCKNDYSAMQAPGGMIATHAKDAMIEKPYAVLVVVGRALLRLHGEILDDQVAPLDAKGRMISNCGGLKLFNRVGRDFLGIPRLGEGIFRTIQMTMAVKRRHDEGVDISTDEGINILSRETRSSKITTLSLHNNAQPAHLKGYSILAQGNKGLQGPKRTKVGGGEPTNDNALLASIAASIATMAETQKMLAQQAQAPGGQKGIPAGPQAQGGQGGTPAGPQAHGGQRGL